LLRPSGERRQHRAVDFAREDALDRVVGDEVLVELPGVVLEPAEVRVLRDAVHDQWRPQPLQLGDDAIVASEILHRPDDVEAGDGLACAEKSDHRLERVDGQRRAGRDDLLDARECVVQDGPVVLVGEHAGPRQGEVEVVLTAQVAHEEHAQRREGRERQPREAAERGRGARR
jgi:hypothetical protein